MRPMEDPYETILENDHLEYAVALTLCVGAQATENTMLKVGLKYGTNALFTARLQN